MSKKDTQTAQDINDTKLILTGLLQDKWRGTATSIFTYDNLPDGLDSQIIEDKLYLEGTSVFIKDKALDYLVGSYVQRGGLNFYGFPVRWFAIGHNGYHEPYNNKNSVLIHNNKLRKPTKPFIDFYIDKLVNVEGAIDVNINAIKTPFVFSGEQSNLLTFKNIYKKLTGNEPVIYADKGLSTTTLNAFNTNAPYHVDKLMVAFSNYESRILNYLGLKYVGVEKRERLVVAEAENSEEYTDTNFANMLNARQIAVEQINTMFGLSIKVGINPELKHDEKINEEDNKNGTIHNDIS